MPDERRRLSRTVSLVLGAVMVALGLYVALRVVQPGTRSLTGRVALDVAFGAFFVIRGVLQLRRARG